MDAAAYRESLRALKPRVFVDGRSIASVADEPSLAPGIAALGVTYDLALRDDLAPLLQAVQPTSGRRINRMLATDTSSADLLDKLEAVRVLCRETGCAQRYLAHDAFCALLENTGRTDDDSGTGYRDRFLAWMHDFQARDLAVGIAMTDAKGDRSLRPHAQGNADAYLHIVERNAQGIVISGAKAIVTGAPYVHELLVMPCRAMTEADADFAVCCAVPIDADGLTIVARPAGRPGEKAALFSAKFGQSTGVCVFERVFVPWERVFLAGEWQHSAHLTYRYATHHRHTCIAARAGFGDLLIGAGALMCEANGLDPSAEPRLKEQMVRLITIVEGFYACGVAASTYAQLDAASGVCTPDPVFANIGKLLMAQQIYEMHRIAHEVSGGLVVCLPGPDEDHNPETQAMLADVLRANPAVPYAKRIEAARFIEDLTASYQAGWYSVISLHGGGSPAAMTQEIWRHYPVGSKVELVERLLDRGVLADDPARAITKNRQPGRCCDRGCAGDGATMKDLPT